MIQLRSYQIECVNSIFQYFYDNETGNALCALPTGCHAKGTELLMYDGSIKLVENIKINDKLMGPDSTPRTVLNLAKGNEQMVRIIPTKGEPFIVNINHILHLYKTNERSVFGERCYNSTLPDFKNVKVSEYLNKSKWFKHTHKLIRTEVEFSNEYKLEIWPWFLGLILGDGCLKNQLSVTTMDEEIAIRVKAYVEKAGCNLRIYKKENNKAKNYYIFDPNSNRSTENRFTSVLRDLKLWGKTAEHKFIPDCYKLNNRKVRLDVLAGILDADGHLDCAGNFDYISKSEQLAKDVVFIARSLGFAAYIKSCIKSSQTGFKAKYYRCCISGDLSIIPCVVNRKKAEPRQQIKNHLVTGFKVELLENDDFYGFALDKDHLYLTGDFTIHHNTGKALCIADFIIRTLNYWPNQRILQLVDSQILVEQNYKKLTQMWANAPAGIYCAGLDQKDIAYPVIFGSLGSVRNNVEAFGHRDIVIVDECHCISPDDETGYRQIISKLLEINPYLRVIGLTATKYRLGQGLLTDGENALFTDVCFDITGINSFNRLIAEGFLSPVIARPTQVQLDVSEVSISAGDFNQKKLQKAVDKQEITHAALKEALQYSYDRNCWLVFASGIEHSEHISDMLNSLGISATFIHSKVKDKEREERLEAFKTGKIKALVGFRIFTKGFDHPPIDLIIDLYPTVSPNMHVQKVGRGTRPYDFTNPQQYILGFDYIKRNCLVLDYAGNTRRIGPINDPVIPRKKGTKTGEIPVKICEKCGLFNHTSARYCGGKPYPSDEGCGAEFVFKTKLTTSAGTDELLRGDSAVIEAINVDRVIYHKHTKIGSNPSIKVSYYSGIRRFTEYVCFEGKGYARTKAVNWWRQRHASEPPTTTDEALIYVSQLRMPKKVRLQTNLHFPEVLEVEF